MNSAHALERAWDALRLPSDDMRRALCAATLDALLTQTDRIDERTIVVDLHGHEPDARDNPFGAWAWRGERTPTRAGALSGLRVAVKDNIAVAHWPLGLGGARRDIMDRDALLVERLLANGAHLVGVAQCEDMVQGGESFTSRPRPVANPWAPDLSAGGSSSGSAALVACGAVDVAIGTDSGGSIRVPAARCGVLGMKPTFGLVPYDGVASIEPTLEHAGPLSLSVDANMAALAAMSDQPLEALQHKGAGRLRLGVLEHCMAKADPFISEAVRAELGALEEAGVELVPIRAAALDAAPAIHAAIYAIGQAAQWAAPGASLGFAADERWTETMEQSRANAPDVLVALLVAGHAAMQLRPTLYARAQYARRRLQDDIDRALFDVDALALPTVYAPAPLAPDVNANPFARLAAYLGDAGDQPAFNVSGHPVLAAPIGCERGMPASLALVGRRQGEGVLYALARMFEPEGGFARAPSGRGDA